MRFTTCRGCGKIFTGSLTGQHHCPHCGAKGKPSSEGLNMEWVQQPPHAILKVSGSHYRIGDLADLQKSILEILQMDPESLALDLPDIDYIDSGFIGVIASALRSQHHRQKAVYVITPNPQIADSLETIHLGSLVRTFPDREAYQKHLDVQENG